jgi:hypothetical protein
MIEHHGPISGPFTPCGRYLGAVKERDISDLDCETA